MRGLRVLMLGRPRLELDGQPLTQSLPAKGQALVYYLAASGETQSRSTLAGLLWGDLPEASARANLRLALTKLRRLCGEAIVGESGTLRLNPALPLQCDVALLLAAGRERSPSVDRLATTAALYRGPFLEGFEIAGLEDFEQWLRREREHCARAAIALWRDVAAARAAHGDTDRAIDAVHRWLAIDQTDEDAHRELMRLLDHAGRRTAAIAQYETCRQVLAQAMGAKPSATTFELYRRIHAAVPAEQPIAALPVGQAIGSAPAGQAIAAVPAQARASNLPEPTGPLLGRERAVREIVQRLSEPECRCLTLVGPGGIGKTRLALAVAPCLADRFPDGTAFVHSGAEPGEDEGDAGGRLLVKLATALGLPVSAAQPARTTLVMALAPRRMLLVLDNLETAPGAGAFLAALAEAAPAVRVLATSRVRLGGAREWLYDVPGLAVDGEGRPSPAARLFAARAQPLRPDFDLATELAAVEAICRQLDGMPLAIELAAQWVRSLDLAAIARRLEADQALLAAHHPDADARHASMARVIDDSWRLLSTGAREAVRSLGVFPGGFDDRAAEAVAGVTPALAAELVDHSWLRRRSDGRLGMHAALARFARGRLAGDPPREAELRQRHRDHYARLVATLGPATAREGGAAAMTELDRETDNLRQAGIATLEGGERGEIYRLLDAIWPYLRRKGMFEEAADLFRRAADTADATPWQQAVWALREAECHYQLCRAERANDAYDRAFARLGVRCLDDPARTLADRLRGAWRALEHAAGADPVAGSARSEAILGLGFLGQMAAFVNDDRRSLAVAVLLHAASRGRAEAGERLLLESGLTNVFGAIPLHLLAEHHGRHFADALTTAPEPAGAVANEFFAVHRWQNARWSACVPMLERAANVFRERGLPRNYFESLSLIGKVHYVHGRFEHAAEHFTRLLEQARAVGHGPAEHWGLIGLTEAMLRTGGATPAVMTDWMRRAGESMAGLETTDRAYVIRWHGVRASVALAAGNSDEALEAALVGASAIARAGLAGMWAYEGFGGVIEVLFAHRRAAGAEVSCTRALADTLAAMRRHARRYRAMRPRLLIYEATASVLEGGVWAARRRLERAIALAQRQDMPYEVARAREARAALAGERGGAAVADHLAAAAADYLACGARRDWLRCRARGSEEGTPAGRSAPPGVASPRWERQE